MKSLLVIGECMLELKLATHKHLAYSYAGDTYNAAVYAKRAAPSLEVSYMSAIGTDLFSKGMLEAFAGESINTDWVMQSPSASIGLYAISTDDKGERSFTYWRKQSAATQVMSLLNEQALIAAPKSDIIYFSGISLAILSDVDKQKLLDCIVELRANGAQVAFDPNYRPHMWDGKQHAKMWIERAYSMSDIVLPGLDEHRALYGHATLQELKSFLAPFSIAETIIKCDTDGVYVFNNNNEQFHLPFVPAPTQVDSTAAGDSFCGTYFANRLLGRDIPISLKNAGDVARLVVQHSGAIIDKDVYDINFSAC